MITVVSLANRLRLTLQVIEAVREAVGPDLILGMRVTGDELTEGGLSADEMYHDCTNDSSHRRGRFF